MKTYAGSIQKRGRLFYLVVHKSKKQRWFALKTDKIRVARIRAAEIAPADPNNEEAWLEQLIRAGEEAKRKRASLKAKSELTWDNLADIADNAKLGAISDDTKYRHSRWMRILADCVSRVAPKAMPWSLTVEQSKEIAATLAREYVSTPRLITYYRSVWCAVGLDWDAWPKGCGGLGGRVRHEHYRRLAVEEISRVYRDLLVKSPELADMVLIGYSTGLRLSDVVELELSEVDIPFLKVCPNKTRRHKLLPLKIPLSNQVKMTVRRLADEARQTGRERLFPKAEAHMVSHLLADEFRRCGVEKVDLGMASFHSLRATFISQMDDAGIPPHITDSITGHGGGGMHARYTQPSDRALLMAVRKGICLI